MKRVTLAVLIFIAYSNVYSAEPKNKVYKKTQKVDFESTDVDGLVRSPDGAYLNPKKGIKFLPLYRVEKNLDREIKKSVEYLR